MSGLRGGFINTMSKIQEAMSLSQGSGICVLVVFMVIVFVFLWRMIRFIICFEQILLYELI